MEQHEIAKNLLADKSCSTCFRSGMDCGEYLSDIGANNTCKNWEKLKEIEASGFWSSLKIWFQK